MNLPPGYRTANPVDEEFTHGHGASIVSRDKELYYSPNHELAETTMIQNIYTS